MNKTILIIDDVAYNRLLVIRNMKKKFNDDIKIYEASDAIQGKSMIKMHNPSVVICDINLPKKSGLALYSDINKTKPDINFLFITSLPIENIQLVLSKVGINIESVFSKPIDYDKLNNVISYFFRIGN